MEIDIACADVLDWAADYDGPPFHAILSDPPYGWEFMGRSHDNDIALKPETWAALAQHLYPGGFIFAFAGPRTYHRLACALEDAGLRLFPPLVHLQAQGFPKATRIDTQIDRVAGRLEEREVVGYGSDGSGRRNRRNFEMGYRPGVYSSDDLDKFPITAPVTDLARTWQGHRYGLQSLKPCTEIIAVARKDLTCRDSCDTVAEITFWMEVLLCISLTVQDAESPTNQLHQLLKAVVESFAHGNVGAWESLGNVTIAIKNLESSQVRLTLQDFVVGPALTRDAINHLGLITPSGQVASLSAKDTSTFDGMENISLNIALLWKNILAGVLNLVNTSTTSMATDWIIDCQISKSILSQIIQGYVTQDNESNGLRFSVISVENLLRSVLTKLQLQNTISVAGDVSTTGREKRGEVEFIAVAQKPYEGKPVDCIVRTGAGALWIDGGRIGVNTADLRRIRNTTPNHSLFGLDGPNYGSSQGRWPPNFALSHLPHTLACKDCAAVHPIQPVIECCPDCGGELELVEGCKRVGVKRVKTKDGKGSNKVGELGAFDNGEVYGTGQGVREQTRRYMSDGRETVSDWQCARGPENEVICPVERLGEQSGEREVSGTARLGKVNKAGKAFFGSCDEGYENVMPNDKGTCARFYFQAGWENEKAECKGDHKYENTKGIEAVDIWGRESFQPADTESVWLPDAPRCATDMEENSQQILLETQTSERHTKQRGRAENLIPQADFAHETAERLAQGDPVKYCPKAAKRERNQGLDDFYWKRDKTSPSGFVRATKEEWEKLDKRERAMGNIHSTVKPLSLLKWLATLLLPPPEYTPRRLMVPFAGSGSEMIAAMQAGWEEVTGIELMPDYIDIARARLAKARLEMSQLEMNLSCP